MHHWNQTTNVSSGLSNRRHMPGIYELCIKGGNQWGLYYTRIKKDVSFWDLVGQLCKPLYIIYSLQSFSLAILVWLNNLLFFV